MKHLTRHLLPLVLALVTIGALLTSALAARTDKLILTTYPEAGSLSHTDKTSTFVVIPDIISATNTDVSEQYDIYYYWFLNDKSVSDKSSTNDASAEYVGNIRKIFHDAGIIWQTAELGKIDVGGGGTVAMYIANHNINTVDLGVPVLSMHAPMEVISKNDLYETHKALCAFCK